ncbi:hypothetical protein P692DRAFT_20582966 [Suillus brevipes Sb2]|nr:hypothetical protein P692DRAFT_20582966 [Suillus brevipes Sb2]
MSILAAILCHICVQYGHHTTDLVNSGSLCYHGMHELNPRPFRVSQLCNKLQVLGRTISHLAVDRYKESANHVYGAS